MHCSDRHISIDIYSKEEYRSQMVLIIEAMFR